MFLERVAVSKVLIVTGRILIKAVAGGYFAPPRSVSLILIAYSKQQPLVFEFQSFAKERKAWRWRKVSIDSTGWQTVELPTR